MRLKTQIQKKENKIMGPKIWFLKLGDQNLFFIKKGSGINIEFKSI